MKIYMVRMMMLFSVLILAACGVSLEEEKEKAVTNAEKAFHAPSEAANEDDDIIQFHIPERFSIKDQAPNNIILEKDAHPYILFYNQHEGKDSNKVYEITNTSSDKIIVDKTFLAENRFGYLIIIEGDEGQFEVTAGIGGIKVTTNSELKKIAENAEILMKIANSGIINRSAS